MAVALIAVGLFVYSRVSADLSDALDTSLRSRADDLAAAIPAGSAAAGQERLVESDESFAQILGLDAGVIFGTPGAEGKPLLDRGERTRARRGPLFLNRGPAPGADERTRLFARPAGNQLVVVGASREDREEALASLRGVLLVGGPLALLAAALAAYALATAALRPVNAMRREATDISRLGGGHRLPVPPGSDELAQLGTSLNEMLARLEQSAERERDFVASASHELRTPLALLKAELELALREGRTPEELREAVASAAAESDRLVQLAEDLLVLAQAEDGRLPVRPETIQAGELLATTARRFEVRAAEEGRELSVAPADGLVVHADRLRAEQALANLVDNALRHGSGTVELSADAAGADVRLHVGDRGPGFDPALAGRAFERFTRGDRARSRGGTGLGLAIVDAIARSHGGRAGTDPRSGGGADAWIELPSSHAGFMGED